MRKRYGELFRGIVEGCVQPSECVRVEFSVDAELQMVDVYIDRDGDVSGADQRQGLFGKITAERVIIEAFHSLPSSEAIALCVMKQRALHAKRVRTERALAKKETRRVRKLAVPMLWILSAGNPGKAKSELEFRPMQDEQAGVYTLATAWRTRLVVISELADDRQTLLLRLMGRGKTREAAARQLITTYAGTWEAMLLLRPMERLRLTFTQNPTQFTRNERREIEALMDVLERAEQIRDELRREGHIAGMVEGKLEGKLEKARTALFTVLATRKLALTAAESARIEACGDEDILERWLQNAAVAATTAEVFAGTSAQPDAE